MQDRLVTDNMNGGDDLETRPLINPGPGDAVHDDVHKVTGTLTSSTINLTNTILGAGVLAMPGALASVGLGLGILMMLLSAAGSIFGLTLLSMCAGRVRGRCASFFTVSKMTYPSAALWFDLAIAVKCFGVSVSYLIIIRDLMPKVIIAVFPTLPPTSLFLSPTFWVTVAILLVSPLAYARHLDSLKHTSAAALMALVYLVLVVVGYFIWPVEGLPEPPKWEEIKWVHVDATFFSVVPIFVFAFSCHHNIFAVYNELIDNTLPRITTVIHTSIGISTLVYHLIGILGYLTFTRSWGASLTNSNIISLYPSSPFITLVQLSISLLFLFSYPLQSHPARSCVDRITQGRGDRMSWWRHVGITTGLLVGSFGVAVVVGDLERVLSFVGATGSTMICYILPGMLYFKMRDDLDRGQGDGVQRGWLKYAALALAGFGVMVMVVSVYVQVTA